MEIKILGICGSPVKGETTNTEYMVKAILDSCKGQEAKYSGHVQINTELVVLGESNIEAGCTHCNWCLDYQTADVYCSINDDMRYIYPKIVEADGLIFGTPVYIGGMSWLMASFIHRIRALLEGRYYGIRGPLGGVLKEKILAASSVAWVRHAGVAIARAHLIEPAEIGAEGGAAIRTDGIDLPRQRSLLPCLHVENMTDKVVAGAVIPHYFGI